MSTTPPQPLFADYVEMALLGLIYALGLPLNILVFRKRFTAYRLVVRSQPTSVKAAFLLLKLHLTVANLLMLNLFCPLKMSWLWTYRWLLGDFACKAAHTIWVFSFFISSNVIACIAIDRASTVHNIAVLQKSGRSLGAVINHNYTRFVRRLLSVAWAVAFLGSLPQLYPWTVFPVTEAWSQCTTIWMIKKVEFNETTESASEKIYFFYHAATTFWGPITVVGLAYLYIVFVTLQLSRSGNGHGAEAQEQSSTATASQAGQHDQTSSVRREPSLVMPSWRRQLSSNVFRTAALIIGCYVACWAPYNVLEMLSFADRRIASALSDHANWLRVLILCNAICNPFLYGFTD